MTWNCIGSALLVHTHSDVDRSNTSYYGTSGLFLLSSDGELSAQVPQSKDGQIHDVKWSPVGDRYDTIMQHNTTHLQLLTVKSQLLSLIVTSQSLIELPVPTSLVLILSMERRWYFRFIISFIFFFSALSSPSAFSLNNTSYQGVISLQHFIFSHYIISKYHFYSITSNFICWPPSICCENDRKRSAVVCTKIVLWIIRNNCQNYCWPLSVILTANREW